MCGGYGCLGVHVCLALWGVGVFRSVCVCSRVYVCVCVFRGMWGDVGVFRSVCEFRCVGVGVFRYVCV